MIFNDVFLFLVTYNTILQALSLLALLALLPTPLPLYLMQGKRCI